jgi:adenylate cyclase
MSKAERGYLLHSGIPKMPVKGGTVALVAAMPPFEAFRRIALSCLQHLQQNHPGTLGSDDPEYIHQMRVAMRRLRAAVHVFAPELPAQLAESLLEPLSALMRQLGRARDLDVLLGEIANPVLSALPNEPRLPALASDITNRCCAARARAIAMLADPEYGRTLLASLEALQPAYLADAAALPLLGFASARLRRLKKQLRRLASTAAIDDPASLHALRIGIKRLRYALEFFSPLAAPRNMDRVLHQLAGVQEKLGQLNDLANAGAMLMDCAGDDPRLREAVTLIGGWHGSRYAGLLAGMARDRLGLARLRLPQLQRAAA